MKLFAKIAHFGEFGLFLSGVVAGILAVDRVILFLGF